jgi:hypothetical protein
MATITFLVNGPGDETGITSQQPGSGAHWEKMLVAGQYVYTSSTGQQTDLYTIGVSIGGGRINSVTVNANLGQLATSNANTIIKFGGVKYNGANTAIGVPNHAISTVYTLSPATGSLWSWSEIYSAQIGARMGAFGMGYSIQLNSVSVTIDYTVENVKCGAISFI